MRMFGKTWRKATGTVVAKTIDGSTNQGIDHKFVVEIQADGLDAFRAEVKLPRIAIDFKEPIVGQRVGVEFDEKSRRARFDKDDPQLSFKSYRAANDDSFEAMLKAPAGTAAPAAPGTPRSPFAGGGMDSGQLAAIQALIAGAGSGAGAASVHGAADGGPAVIKLDRSNPDYEQLRAQFLDSLGVADPRTAQPDDQAPPRG
jgi:hypothetical protein